MSAATTGQEFTALSPAPVYAKLGVKPLINGMGTVTVLGGSIMPPEVVAAMQEASRFFVRIPELKEKTGTRLAELLNVPAAMVTTGAAGAITAGTAACMAHGDPKLVAWLPRSEGLCEVIQQKSHRSGYEAQMTICGARIVTIETRQELDRAINEKTAMMFFLNKAEADGKIGKEEWIAVGKKRGVPTFNDAAADVPPKGRLTEVVQQGFELVCFSGGKGLMGPQSTGLLLGRKDLIAAGQAALSPNGGVGRGMKVGKEEMMGLLAAVERYLKTDHEKERELLDGRVSAMREILAGLDGVESSRMIPKIANEVPHLQVRWDREKRKIAARELMEQLESGEPSIAVLGNGSHGITVSVWMMRGNEHEVVARRVREVFEKA
jgi:L-seryl-tRNA(Ser) seleniumtransferase